MIDVQPDCDVFDPCAFMVDRICDDSKGVYECICLPGYLFNDTTNSCDGLKPDISIFFILNQKIDF